MLNICTSSSLGFIEALFQLLIVAAVLIVEITVIFSGLVKQYLLSSKLTW